MVDPIGEYIHNQKNELVTPIINISNVSVNPIVYKLSYKYRYYNLMYKLFDIISFPQPRMSERIFNSILWSES